MKLPPAGASHDEREIEAVLNVMQNNPTLEIGESVATLETRIAQLLSKNHGVMVNSGSSSLRLAIDLLRLEPGDEIITSPMTFSTDIAPMVQSGIVPVFVDIEPNTYQIDATTQKPSSHPTCAVIAPTGTKSEQSLTHMDLKSLKIHATSSTVGNEANEQEHDQISVSPVLREATQ